MSFQPFVPALSIKLGKGAAISPSSTIPRLLSTLYPLFLIMLPTFNLPIFPELSLHLKSYSIHLGYVSSLVPLILHSHVLFSTYHLHFVSL